MRTDPALHSVPPQTLLCLHSDDPRRHGECAACRFQARRSAPTSAEANGVCSTGAAHAALARLPNVLRFASAAKRSGAASGAGAGWARARAGYSEYTDTSTWRVAWHPPRKLSSIVLSTFAA